MERHALAAAVLVSISALVSCAPAPVAVPSLGGGSAPPSASETPSATRTAAPSVTGKGRLESQKVQSAVLRRTLPYFAYLPPGYDENPTARYPVAYLLHGGSGANTEWIDYGVTAAADRLMGSGSLPPFILVLPQGDQEYWVDHVVDRATGANGEKWGTYTAKEVVPEIDKRYRTIARPEARAIGGLSMGAHGALQLSINFPGIWQVVGSHSPALRPFGDAPTYLGSGAEFAARDPAALIRAHPEIARTLTYWLDSGDVDPWRRDTESLHQQMLGEDIPHEWRPFAGDHSLQYWSAHVEDYLRYYAGALCRDPRACPDLR